MSNAAQSIKARLSNLARVRNADPMNVMTTYALERLLYRLSVSSHANDYCLKGAMLFNVWGNGDPHRPTSDLDLSGFDPAGDIAKLRLVLDDICRMAPQQVGHDYGLVFDPATLRIGYAKEDGVPGGKILVTARLHTAHLRVRIDVGFGHSIRPGVRRLEYPSLLDLPRLTFITYPPETTVAEKLHAVVQWGTATQRYKDYYDLWIISRSMSFDGKDLVEALRGTFAQQGRPVPSEPIGLTEAFVAAKGKDWEKWVATERLRDKPPSLPDLIESLREFALPALAAVNGGPVPDRWEPGYGWPVSAREHSGPSSLF
jgi:hypothetical protein